MEQNEFVSDASNNVTVEPQTAHFNAADFMPLAFRLSARDFFKCYLDFKPERRFSPVPFFLCCRAIELALKATLLETGYNAKDLKNSNKFGHDLSALYEALPCKKLTASEQALLRRASLQYNAKDFEYFIGRADSERIVGSSEAVLKPCDRTPALAVFWHWVTDFKQYESELANLARKLCDHDSQEAI